MSILKDLFMEEYDRLVSEAEESGEVIDKAKEDEIGDKAANLAQERIWGMCDEAKDRAKYRDKV
jgi:hypothetical protein